jgi:signal transduction histidine kinase
MAVELAEVAAGLPVAASLALAGGITSLREGRRRTALNEAIHELRRPLQVLSLSLPDDAAEASPVESSLQLATVALERLDREVNGASLEEVETAVSVAGLIEEAEQRWRQAAARYGTSLEVDRNGEDLCVGGDRFDLAQALDNLLSNAIEHGGGRVQIQWRRECGWAWLSISDSGCSAGAKAKGSRLPRKRQRRRGHGLRVVGRIARRHGGSFTLSRTPHGAKASLRLPLRQQVDAG